MGIFGGGSVVSPVNGYQFEQLDQKEKETYKTLAAGIADFQKKIAISALDDTSFRRAIEAVILDNPQFFYFDKSKIEVLSGSTGYIVMPQYLYDKRKAEEIRNQIEAETKLIIQNQIRQDMSAFEKVVAIHDYIAKNTMYNFSALRSSIASEAHSIAGMLLKHSAVCEGIAKSFAYLLIKLNIPVLCVDGYSVIDGNEVRHMWNMVKLDGEFYHLDATWDLQEINHFSGQSHVYVLLDDDAMLERHRWDVNKYPVCSETEYNYYAMEGRFYKTRRAYELFIRKCVEERRSFIDVRFSDTMSMPDLTGQWAVSILEDTARRSGVSIRMKYGFVSESCILQINVEYL